MNSANDRIKSVNLLSKAFERMGLFGGQPPIPLPKFLGCNAKFPEEVFDPVMRLFLNDFARAFRVDFGVAAALALSTAAMSCRGRFKVVRDGDHSELLALYSILRLPPSCMKTSMVETMMKPFDSENETVKSLKKIMDATELGIAKKRIKNLENDAALYCDEIKLERFKDEIRKIRKEIDDSTRQNKWRVGSDFTPEGLARAAYQEGGTLAIVGSELGKLKKFPANRDDVLLAGWEGASFESNTKKDPFKIDRLCLNLLLFVQNETSRKFIEVNDFVNDGLISRFLIVSPKHINLDESDSSLGILTEESKGVWSKKIKSIFDHYEGNNVTLYLKNTEAKSQWNTLWNQYQKISFLEEMKPGMSNWYRKAAGTALRIAGILHLLNTENSSSSSLSLSDINNSIKILKFYREHAEFMLQNDMEMTLKRANRILEIFKATEMNNICERDVYRKVGNGEPDEDYRSALKLLKEYRWVDVSGERGNKCLCLNPQARDVWDKRSAI